MSKKPQASPPPLTNKEFFELQKRWYQKLKEEGFDDIEDTNHPKRPLKTCDADYFRRLYSPERFAYRQEYYRLCSIFLHTYSFQKEHERFIWQLHTEGVPCRKISIALEASGLLPPGKTMKKSMVHRVIKHFLHIVKKRRAKYS